MARLIAWPLLCSVILSFAVATAPAIWADDAETTKPQDAENIEKQDAEKQDAEKQDAEKRNAEKQDAEKQNAEEAVEAEKKQEEYYELITLFADALEHIDRNYVKEMGRRELVEAAIEGMISKLDTHSSYITPDDVRQFRTNVENKFAGIGIHVTMEQGRLMIVSPLVGAPAYAAGLVSGDYITKIEGESTAGMSLSDAVSKMKGKVGTDVTITVKQGSGKSRDVTVTRALVKVETVLGDHRNDDDQWNFLHDEKHRIAYIRLNSFGRETPKELRKVMKGLLKEELGGLVLDLRFNPGGLLSSAIEISDMFVSDGQIVSTKGRNTKPRSWQAKKGGTFAGFPMAVLVNRYSASASEIVSACLQDHARAIVVGERTYGKGSVQNVINLENGKSVLKLTTAGYQRPNGKNIHRFPGSKDADEWGVTPNENYLIRMSDDEIRALVKHRRDIDVAHGKRLPADEAASSEEAPKNENGDEKKDEVNKDEANKDEAKSDGEKKEDANKDGENKDGEKKDGEKEDGEKEDGEKEDGEKKDGGDADKAEPEASDKPESDEQKKDAEEKPFVDRHLEKALEYLSGELARAE